jgi:hypothetical protein
MDRTMQDMLHYHKLGTDYIRKGLEIDESSS